MSPHPLRLRRALPNNRITFAASGALVAVCAALSTPAAAQTAPKAPESGRLFDITLQARALYDSNVARGTPEVAALRGLSKSDVIYTTDALIDSAHKFGPLMAFLQGTVGYEAYERNHDLNAGRVGLTGGVAGSAGPCGGTLYDQFARHQSDLRDVNLVVTRNIETDNSVGVSLQCAPLIGVTAGVNGVHGTSRSSAAIVPDADTDQVSVFAGYTNHLLGSFQLTGQYQKIKYTNAPSLTTPITILPGVRLYGVGLQYDRPVGARLHGRVGVSYVKAKTDTAVVGPNGDFSGLSANAALTYQPTTRISAELEYVRDIQATLQLGSNYVVNNAANVHLNYKLSPRLAAAVGAAWSRRNYRGNFNPVVLVVVSRDETKSVFGSVTTKLGRKIDLALDATYEDRKTDLPIFDYHAYRVGLTASAHF